MAGKKENIKIESINVSDITLDNIRGYEEEKVEIRKLISLFKDYKKHSKKGIYIPKGIILQGPPGCGKTLLAKAIASECSLPFYNFQSELSAQETLKKLQATFEEASKKAPAIIYIDEIDKLVNNKYYTSDNSRMLTQYILTQLDGLNTASGVLVLASTNNYYDLPEALCRSGRMDKKFLIDYPDVNSIAEILKYYMACSDKFDVDVDNLALKLKGLSGADIKALVNNTLIDCLDKDKITLDDFGKSVNELKFETIGKHWDNKKVLREVLIHEAGHSIVSYVLNGNHGSISGISYGDTGGSTSFDEELEDWFDEDDYDAFGREQTNSNTKKLIEKYTRQTKSQYFESICIALGGLAAEEYFYKQHSVGVSGDLKAVDRLLITYFTCWFGKTELIPSDLLRDGLPDKYLSKYVKERAKLLNKAKRSALKIIKQNRELIIHLVNAAQSNNDVLSSEQVAATIKFYNENKTALNKIYRRREFKQ